MRKLLLIFAFLAAAISASAENYILYTSSDRKKVEPYDSNVFGANITSNTYVNGQGKIVFNGEVTTIGKEAFYRCTSLKSVEIPNSVTTIGESAFERCSSLTSVVIPNSVTTIGGLAFANCTSLISVKIPNSVTTIGLCAFDGCSKLSSVVIGNSVTSIGNRAFFGCRLLKNIKSLNPVPPTILSFTFYDVPSTCSIKVPNIAVSDYSAASDWNEFTKISGLDRSFALTVSSAKAATLLLDYDATIPANVEVYYASEYDGTAVKMSQINDVIPRETGVIVKADAGSYTFAEASTEGTAVADNLLVGDSSPKTFGNDGKKYYKLTYNNSGENLGFYLANADGTIEAKPNKAYLGLTVNGQHGAPARGITIDWGEATMIDNVSADSRNDGKMYNLQGVQVGSGYKGIVIKNGKKMVK